MTSEVKKKGINKQRIVRRQLFPEKLWDLVNKPDSGVQWSPDGKHIHVDRTLLQKVIGTKFRSHNYDSFIRQLHFYGFRKTGNTYHHDKFQRGQPEALLTMKRKYPNLVSASLCQVDVIQSSHCTSSVSIDDESYVEDSKGCIDLSIKSNHGVNDYVNTASNSSNCGSTNSSISLSDSDSKLPTCIIKGPSKSLAKRIQVGKLYITI